MEKKKTFNKEKFQTGVIIVLSLIIVFGLAYFVPELKNCGTCSEEKSITEITMDEYRTLLSGEEVSLIYIASPTCGYCAQQEPIMKQLVNEYDVPVNYLNVNNITSDEANELYSAYGDMQEERYETDGVRTPTILLVQKGEVIDMNLSTISLNELVELLQKYITIEE